MYSDKNNALLFLKVMDELNVPDDQRGVPTVVIGKTVLVGGSEVKERFLSEVENYKYAPEEFDNTNDIGENKLDLALLSVIGASLADAVNPCAFAVLIILMTAILISGDGIKALKAGLSFALSIFISYYLMGLGLYSALTFGGLSSVFYKFIGWLAIVMGLLNLKDWLWYGKGFLMEVPMSWRPHLKRILNSVTSPAGAFCVGFLVSVFLLPCTSGPYIVILGMLAQKLN